MLYRLRQLARALTGRITAAEHAIILQTLTPAEQRFFEQMPRFDQRHVFDVYNTLQQAGATGSLLHAALLHDLGKVDEQGQAIPLVYYGLFVVLQRLAPSLYRRAAAHGGGLLQPFASHATHEQRSVRYAEQAGSPPEVIIILRDYADQRTTDATRMLGWADDLN